MTAEAETNVVAIERIKKYIDMPQEAEWTLPADQSLPASWPTRGEIAFEDFRVRYQACLEPVLKGISFSVKSGEKVGIVGRTGAGKSSLTLSLFRIIESCGGKISIDGVDVATIGLHTLRSRLTIIPQVSNVLSERSKSKKGRDYVLKLFVHRTRYCLRGPYASI